MSVFFFSCSDDNQITGEAIEPDQPEYAETDLDGLGCSESYLCNHLGNVYYNLLADNNSYNQTFYKFNAYHLSGGAHNQSTDTLNFKTYNNIYYIPSESITDADSDVLYDGDYVESSNENIVTLSQEDSASHNLTSELMLTSTTFSVLDSVIWNGNSARYNFRTTPAFKDTTTYAYSHSFDSLFYSTIVDTALTEIYGDVVLIDQNEQVFRNYTDYDTLQINQGDTESSVPVKIKRSKTFSIKDYYVRNNGLMFRETTDCNNNYRQDGAEYLMSDVGSMCTDSGGTWVEDADSACDSYCLNNDEQVSFDVMCWDLYTDDDRLTGRCYDEGSVEAFCDLGNDLYDLNEYFYDIDENGIWNLIGQNYEPWDDRNCNGVQDSNEETIEGVSSSEDCSNISFASWDENASVCYYDLGNNQYDDQESCYTGGDSGCDYKELYKRADSPNVLLVDFSDPDNPNVVLSAYPSDDFDDCGTDGICNEDELDYDPGTCPDGYSGSEEDCCKYNFCWDYDSDTCDYNLDSCIFDDDTWTENLDPNNDDWNDDGDGVWQSGEGTELNHLWDNNELITKDFNENGSWDIASSITNKSLNYQSCNNDCGNEILYIVEDSLRQVPASSSANKVKSQISVQSLNVIDQIESESFAGNLQQALGDYNIVKTEFMNSSGDEDYDYMLFLESEEQDQNGMHYIIKLIHPYYYFAPGFYIPQDIYEFSQDDFWQSIHLENDTMLYSLDGQIIEGQSYYSNYSIETDTANYNVHKEYVVSKETAIREYDDPVSSCFLVTRTITTTMEGTGINFKLRSETYLKEGFPVVKEDISVYWSTAPWQGDTWYPISSIEFKDSGGTALSSNNNLFNLRDVLNLNKLVDESDFDFRPFKITNTIGMQRVEYPNE